MREFVAVVSVIFEPVGVFVVVTPPAVVVLANTKHLLLVDAPMHRNRCFEPPGQEYVPEDPDAIVETSIEIPFSVPIFAVTAFRAVKNAPVEVPKVYSVSTVSPVGASATEVMLCATNALQ